MTEHTRRRHPARNTRIAALGLGATTMLGLTAALGLETDTTNEDMPVDAPQVMVSTPLVDTPPPLDDPTHSILLVARPTESPVPVAEPTPIVTARPTPRAAPRPAPDPAPVATSNGSR